MSVKLKCKKCGNTIEEDKIIGGFSVYPQTNSLIILIECPKCEEVEERVLEIPEFLEIVR